MRQAFLLILSILMPVVDGSYAIADDFACQAIIINVGGVLP